MKQSLFSLFLLIALSGCFGNKIVKQSPITTSTALFKPAKASSSTVVIAFDDKVLGNFLISKEMVATHVETVSDRKKKIENFLKNKNTEGHPALDLIKAELDQLSKQKGSKVLFKIENQVFVEKARENEPYEKFARKEIRKLLLKEGGFRVLTKARRGADYTLRIGCSELIQDIKEARKEVNLGFYFLPFIGPVFTIFEFATGLPLAGRKAERQGVIRFDVQVEKANKEILFSRVFSANFGTKLKEIGGFASVTNKTSIKNTEFHDAIKSVASQATKVLLSKI